ncbi:hypothetical protein [Pyxidicoccus sp. MSG2]|uniref:hypothetical protein n=1 Tax=Pyxidicoccus sp. MSG2 TaxID=2996790 RepID=UPI00226EA484|nr:hypothetical protein [Pyxidicoccus sp. MSG2]MCY1018255.1 hypothetical protein [Pyxidicoccus sp. MSG2]
MLKTRPQAEAELAPHVKTMCAIVQGALEEYVRDYAQLRHKLSARSQSSIINDLMVFLSKERFAENPEVKVVKKRGSFLVNFASGYLIKLKKLDKNLRAANIPTQAVFDFNNQTQAKEPFQAELPGMPPAPTNLHVGYQLLGIALTSSKVWIVCPGAEEGWSWEITAETDGVVVPLDTTAQEKEKPTRTKRRFKPKAEPGPTDQGQSNDSAPKR